MGRHFFSLGVLAGCLVACGAFDGSSDAPKQELGDAGGGGDGGGPGSSLEGGDGRDDADSGPPSCWGYRPANYDPCAAAFDTDHPAAIAQSLSGNTTWSTDAAPDTISDGAATYALYRFASFNLAEGAVLKIDGARPTLIIVDGDVTLRGSIVVTATATAGRELPECGTPPGAGGPTTNWTIGGGGAGYGADGGSGGGSGSPGKPGGKANGNEKISPLRTGCPGGMSGTPQPDSNDNLTAANAAGGGAGGGALEISAHGKLTVFNTASIFANGRGGGAGEAYRSGDGPCKTKDGFDCDSGGGGGGSGGSILLEGASVDIMGSVCAVGGGGGAGGAANAKVGTGGISSTTCDVGAGGTSTASTNGGAGGGIGVGSPGSNSCGSYTSCGGGGGAAGRIRIRAATGPGLTIHGVITPPAFTN